MKKGQQNGGILPEKREGYLKAVEFIIHRLMNFPDNQTRKMGGTNGCRNALSAGAAERSAVFRGTRACMPEAAQPQVAANPISLCARKTARSEGSLAKPNLCPQSPFFAPFLWRSKENEVSEGGRVSAKQKQSLR
ncbi:MULTISPECIES: hypothetical protein [Eikenella]|nr:MULTISPECIES: hypothetical protein [Eikenella]